MPQTILTVILAFIFGYIIVMAIWDIATQNKKEVVLEKTEIKSEQVQLPESDLKHLFVEIVFAMIKLKGYSEIKQHDIALLEDYGQRQLKLYDYEIAECTDLISVVKESQINLNLTIANISIAIKKNEILKSGILKLIDNIQRLSDSPSNEQKDRYNLLITKLSLP